MLNQIKILAIKKRFLNNKYSKIMQNKNKININLNYNNNNFSNN